MSLNLLAILLATVAAWLFGAAWYMSLGRVAPDAMRSRREIATGDTKPPVKALITSFVAELIMANMLAGLIVHLGGSSIRTGLIIGFFCWLGFVATTLVTNDAYVREKPSKTAIDAGHWLGVLLIQGAILGAMN